MRKKISAWVLAVTLVGILPTGVLAATAMFDEDDGLASVYAQRGDLQNAFNGDGMPRAGSSAAGFLMNLEDWARQYGWQEYPELADYAPVRDAPSMKGAPVNPTITSPIYVVIDDATGTILTAQQAETQWPIASITKLMTTKVALESGADAGGAFAISDVDNVGGARLWVGDGTRFTFRDLLAATLVGSANNAANAIARYTGMAQSTFVEEMNDEAAELGLSHTTFVDPTGIELGNVSTAREVAYFASKAFAHETIRKFAGSSRATISALNDATYVRDIKNTNWLLYDPAYDDIYVTAGKTGFLNESGWNLVVRMHPMGEDEDDRSLIVVVLGAAGRRESFDDAANLARWTWKNFTW